MIVYVGQDFDPKTPGIFLAGPSPREKTLNMWRLDAIRILQDYDFDGNIYAPLTEDGGWLGDYNVQVKWEWKALAAATVIVFWIPRSEDLPGYTTNIEFGFVSAMRSGRVVLGTPIDAFKTRYPRRMAQELNTLGDIFGVDLEPIPVSNTLEDTLASALRLMSMWARFA